MDHNKEEANRAKETAQKRFLAKDFAGARKFALQAQSLNPELDGIMQMVATFHMHLSAQNKINGERDYYGVLGVNPKDDDDKVRKRYRKLAVMLHPDRNKSIGAQEAFQFLSQAWGVLSAKAKRADYMNLRLCDGRGASSPKHANNGFQKAAKESVSNTKIVKTSKRGLKRARDDSASASAAAAATTSTLAHNNTSDGTFWTVCRTCTTQHEYPRVYLNQNLLCIRCRKVFIAVETDPPGSDSIPQTFHDHQFNYIPRSATDGRKKSTDNNGVYDSLEWGAVYTGTKNAAHAAHIGSQKAETINIIQEMAKTKEHWFGLGNMNQKLKSTMSPTQFIPNQTDYEEILQKKDEEISILKAILQKKDEEISILKANQVKVLARIDQLGARFELGGQHQQPRSELGSGSGL